MFNPQEVTGRSRTHIVQLLEPRFAAEAKTAQAFLAMRDAAKKDGFDLQPFSSFRDFSTQLRIWNYKFSGKKPLYDIDGKERDFSSLNSQQIIGHILNWSALPGGSRHHWGSEIDVVDGNAMPADYKVKLLPEEVQPGGLFHPLHTWLDDNIARFDFFRPYQFYQGGMYPEPWHLSYAPTSLRAIEDLSVDILIETIKETEIMGKDLLLEQIPAIYRDHILNYVKPGETQHL